MSKTDQSIANISTREAALLAESVRGTVSRFVRAVRERSGTQSNAQNETLAFLERVGPVSIATLASSRGVTHQTMRLIVMKLVDQGFLRLMRDTKDGRAYLVLMTKTGRAQLTRDRAARADWLTQQFLSNTNHEEREILRRAISTLDKLAK